VSLRKVFFMGVFFWSNGCVPGLFRPFGPVSALLFEHILTSTAPILRGQARCRDKIGGMGGSPTCTLVSTGTLARWKDVASGGTALAVCRQAREAVETARQGPRAITGLKPRC